jgi:cell division protein FtsN
MARVERGVYEPSDEVRVFDGAEEEDDAEGSRLPLLIVLALLVLFAFAGVVWLAYTQGVARGRTETPVLAAAPGPEKVAPQNAGGANVQYQGFKIYEQPAPSDDEGDVAGARPPAEQLTQPPQPAKPEPQASKPEPAPAPVQQATNPEPAAKVTTATKSGPAPKPVPAAKVVATTPPPAMKLAVTTPSPAPAATAPSAVANGAPRTLPGVAAPTPKPVPVKVDAPPAAAAKGAYLLQIGAYKSQADADAAWKAYKGKHAALLSGYGSDVQKANLGDKGTWYRLRVAGFSDRDVASALCDRLKADGAGGCIVGK